MSNDSSSGEKTEQPTPKKLRDAREEGQVAQSKELTTLSGMLAVVAVLSFSAHRILELYAKNRDLILYKIQHQQLEFYSIIDTLFASLGTMLEICLPPIIIGAAVSGLVNLLQIGGIVFSKKFLSFDLNKFNPVQNFKQVFSLKNFIKFLRQFIEIGIMAAVAYSIGKHAAKDILQLYYVDIESIVLYMVWLIGKIFSYLFLIHVVCSILDFMLEKRNLTKQLMMSMSEVKQEYKNTEGNPEVKGRRKELHRELLEEGGMEEMMGSSTLVLANPTHIAIVIMYKPSKWKLPVILAKAKGETAQIIFQMAKRMEIPVIREKWLARQLHKLGEVGKYVPSSLLSYVADTIGQNLHLMPKLALEIHQMAQAEAAVNAAKQPIFNNK
jgi:type III secretion protein U